MSVLYHNWYGNRYTEELMLTGNRLYLTDDYQFILVDDETALTSAGYVTVVVEGEEAVKAIVK